MNEQTSFTRHFQPSAFLLEARTKQLESDIKRNVKSILILQPSSSQSEEIFWLGRRIKVFSINEMCL